MHQTLALSSDSLFVCRPQTAGGHSHKAPAISEVMRLPEETGEANSLAKTVTLEPFCRSCNADVMPTTPPPITNTRGAREDLCTRQDFS